MTKGLSWIYVWTEEIPTQDLKLGMSLALLESEDAWSLVSKGESSMK